MKRNVVLMFVMAMILALGLAACSDSSPKIAVIDAEKVYQDSALAKQGMAYIEGLSRGFNERIAQMREEAMVAPTDEALARKLQEELMELQQRFEAEQTTAATQLNKAFEEALEEYRQKNKLDVILPKQVALAIHPSGDVTAAVTALFDSKTVVFGSAPAPAAPVVAPEAAPAAVVAPEAAPAKAE